MLSKAFDQHSMVMVYRLKTLTEMEDYNRLVREIHDQMRAENDNFLREKWGKER